MPFDFGIDDSEQTQTQTEAPQFDFGVDWQSRQSREADIEQDPRMIAARRRNQDVSGGLEAFQRSVERLPVAGAVFRASRTSAYGGARERIRQGTPERGDFETVANYEARQRDLQQRTESLGGFLGETAMNLPAMAGEALIAGNLLPQAGAAPTILARARAMATPTGVGRLAAQTALMPSMYLDQGVQRNVAANRDPTDPQGMVPAFGLGMLNVAALESVGGFGNQAKTAIGGYAQRALGGTLVSAQASHLATGAVQALMGDEAHFGPVVDLLRGRTNEAFRGFAADAITFGTFAFMHGRQRETRNLADSIREYVDDAEQFHRRRGLSQEAARERATEDLAREGRPILDNLADGLVENPELSQPEGRERLGETNPAIRRIAEAFTDTLPERPESPVPERTATGEPPVTVRPETASEAKPERFPAISDAEMAQIGRQLITGKGKKLKEGPREEMIRQINNDAFLEAINAEKSRTSEAAPPSDVMTGKSAAGAHLKPYNLREQGVAAYKPLGDGKSEYIPAKMKRVNIKEEIARLSEQLKTENKLHQTFTKANINDLKEASRQGRKEYDRPLPPPPGHHGGEVEGKDVWIRRISPESPANLPPILPESKIEPSGNVIERQNFASYGREELAAEQVGSRGERRGRAPAKPIDEPVREPVPEEAAPNVEVPLPKVPPEGLHAGRGGGAAQRINDNLPPIQRKINENSRAIEELLKNGEGNEAQVAEVRRLAQETQELERQLAAEFERPAKREKAGRRPAPEAPAAAGEAGGEGGTPEGFGRPITPEERLAGGGFGFDPKTVGAAEGPKDEIALANRQIDSDRISRGLTPLMSEARKSNPEVWDQAMARLAADPRLSERLVNELQANPRATTIDENALLLHRRISVANEMSRAILEQAAKLQEWRTYEQRQEHKLELNEIERRYDFAKAEMNKVDDVARKTGTEWGRAGQFRRQLAKEDFSLSSMMMQAEAAKGKPLTEQERSSIIEQQKNIEESTNRLAEAESGEKPAAPEGQPEDMIDLQVRLRKAKTVFDHTLAEFKRKAEPVPVRVFGAVRESANLTRSFLTAFDLSAVLRQGGFITFAHPIRGLRAFPEMLRSFTSEHAYERAQQAINNRDNALLYRQAGLYLAETAGPPRLQEEAYLSRWVNKIPGLAGSERAYNAYLNRIRADSFDAMAAGLSTKGKPTLQEARAIANFINVATGRGGLGPLESSGQNLATIFFSPRYVASRFQLLAGQPFYLGTAATRMAVAQEYARALVGIGAFYGLASLLAPDRKITFDPRSADFGKVQLGRSRIDPLMGLSQVAVFTSRIASGQTTSTSSGRVTDLTNPRSGQRSTSDVIWQFLRSKLAPVPGAALDIASRRDYANKPITPLQVAQRNAVPIAIKDVWDALKDQGVPRGPAMGLLAILGMGTQVYNKPQAQTQTPPQR